MRRLLLEYTPFEISKEQITESITKNSGKLIVSGILQRANVVNQNNRIYPRSILEKRMKEYIKTKVKESRALGELDHASNDIVNLSNVSHNITEAWWKNDEIYGKIEVLSTPSGNILRELFKAGIKLGISSRALGSVKPVNEDQQDGPVEVQDDLSIISYDFVSDPATHGAFMNPINESKSYNKWNKIDQIILEILSELVEK